MKIYINGEEAVYNTNTSLKFTDLIELIKASIDPDHMITSLSIDGRDIAESEWSMTLGQIAAESLDVCSGSPEIYVAERMNEASSVVRSCYLEFRDARKGFQDGDSQDGNRKLKIAVDTLRAFFEWYGTLVMLVPEGNREKIDITSHVQDISETCKKICQQQLYQSWWALGESIEKDLEPKLDRLEDVCRRVVKHVQPAIM